MRSVDGQLDFNGLQACSTYGDSGESHGEKGRASATGTWSKSGNKYELRLVFWSRSERRDRKKDVLSGIAMFQRRTFSGLESERSLKVRGGAGP